MSADDTPASLVVKTITWNVGNAEPRDIDTFLGDLSPPADLIVVGLQESSYAASASPRMKRAQPADGGTADFVSHYVRDIADHLHGFSLAASQVLGEMELAVYAREALLPKISNIGKSTERTGVMNVIANKGGIAIRLCIGNVFFAFVSSHLAAHSGQEFLVRRNEDVAEILRGTRELAVQSPSKTDISTQFHYVFWMGDLNYRLDPNLVHDGAVPLDHLQRWQRVKELIDAKDWATLHTMDELKREREAGRVFAGFSEGDSNFSPTFKVERAAGFKYLAQRVPSYCDRILWKTFPGLKDTVEQLSLEAVPDSATSDHKPVRSVFRVNLPTLPDATVPKSDLSTRGARILLTDLAGENLAPMDAEMTSDPFVVFSSIEAFGQDMVFMTDPILKTLNPKWGAKQVPVLHCQHSEPAALEQAHVLCTVYDKDRFSAHDLIGTGVLSLKGSTAGVSVPFELQLYKYARPRGKLTGRVLTVKSSSVTASV
eukprot:m.118341 g.118341  ORF g.118341 m.118341 type:complete len:486 (+) comp16426_c3_seq1:194-1651(+)